jgi:hypothetical protein
MAYEPHLPAWGTAQIKTIRPATGTAILCEITALHIENRTVFCVWLVG